METATVQRRDSVLLSTAVLIVDQNIPAKTQRRFGAAPLFQLRFRSAKAVKKISLIILIFILPRGVWFLDWP